MIALLASTKIVLATEGSLLVTEDVRLAEDHRGTIVIDADNVTLDCNGHAVDGDALISDDFLFGISVVRRTGVSILNCHVRNFDSGIRLQSAENCAVVGNKMKFNGLGIDIESSGPCTLDSNSARDNRFAGISISESSGNTLTDNVTSGNGTAGISLFASNDTVLIQNYAKFNGQNGVVLNYSSDENVLWKNVARDNNGVGFLNQDSDANVYIENKASRNIDYDAMVRLEEHVFSWGNVFINNDFRQSFHLDRVILHEK